MENNEILTSEVNSSSDFDVVEEYNKLRANTVPKNEFDDLNNKYTKVVKALFNNEGLNAPNENTNIDYKAERTKLINEGKHTNLEYVTKALEIRDAALREGVDTNMPFGPKAEYTENDADMTDFVARKLRDLVDRADGNAAAFNFLLNQEMVDNMPISKMNGRVNRR